MLNRLVYHSQIFLGVYCLIYRLPQTKVMASFSPDLQFNFLDHIPQIDPVEWITNYQQHLLPSTSLMSGSYYHVADPNVLVSPPKSSCMHSTTTPSPSSSGISSFIDSPNATGLSGTNTFCAAYDGMPIMSQQYLLGCNTSPITEQPSNSYINASYPVLSDLQYEYSTNQLSSTVSSVGSILTGSPDQRNQKYYLQHSSPVQTTTSPAGTVNVSPDEVGGINRSPGTSTGSDSLYESLLTASDTSPAVKQYDTELVKPEDSYIAMIAKAILNSEDDKLLLGDIYSYITENYDYYRNMSPSWRNSIRHNLTVNDCFIKTGQSATGRGFLWAIHHSCVEAFKSGDFRRREARRRVQQAHNTKNIKCKKQKSIETLSTGKFEPMTCRNPTCHVLTNWLRKFKTNMLLKLKSKQHGNHITAQQPIVSIHTEGPLHYQHQHIFHQLWRSKQNLSWNQSGYPITTINLHKS